jgi:hypothetical protein
VLTLLVSFSGGKSRLPYDAHTDHRDSPNLGEGGDFDEPYLLAAHVTVLLVARI